MPFVLLACGGLSEAEQRYIAGAEHQEAGRLAEAIEDYDEAIRLDPQLALAYANRAVAYTLLGRDAEAQQDVDRAVVLGIDPAALRSEIERLRQLR